MHEQDACCQLRVRGLPYIMIWISKVDSKDLERIGNKDEAVD